MTPDDALEAGSRRNRRLVRTMYPTLESVLAHIIGVFVLRVVAKGGLQAVPPVYIQVPVFASAKTPDEFCAYASVACGLPSMTCVCLGIAVPGGRRAVAVTAALTGAEYKAGEMVYLFVEFY